VEAGKKLPRKTSDIIVSHIGKKFGGCLVRSFVQSFLTRGKRVSLVGKETRCTPTPLKVAKTRGQPLKNPNTGKV